MSNALNPSKDPTSQAIMNASAQGQPTDRPCAASPAGHPPQPPPSSTSGQPQPSSSDYTPQQVAAYVRPSHIAAPVPSRALATAPSTARVSDVSQPFRGQGFGHPFPRAPRTPDIAYYQTPPEIKYPGAIPIPPPKPSDNFRGNGAYESPYDPRVGIPSYHGPSSPYWAREENESGTSDTQGNGQ